MLTSRTPLSLAQFLAMQPQGSLSLLLEKHGFVVDWSMGRGQTEALANLLRGAPEDQILRLLEEVVRTQSDLRELAQAGDRFDERWTDLVRYLALDGYRIEGGQLVPLDPTIPSATPIEDDLTAELERSGLPEAGDVKQAMTKSEEAFRRMPPNYNECLTEARIALQHLGRTIGVSRRQLRGGSFDEEKWGQVLAYLRKSDLISEKEEEGLAGVFSFVSPSAHIPLGFTEEEMTRLGRSLCASMCYFLVKLYNASK